MGKDDKKKRGKNDAPPSKLTKEEDAMARYVRFNCPTNTTMFEGNEVHYFSGKKAVDTLVDSKKYGAGSKNPKFPTPASAEKWLQSLLERGLFFRAKKVVLKKKPPAAALTEDEGTKKSLTDKAKQSPKPSPKPGKSPKGGKKGGEEAAKSAEDEEEKPAEGESDAEGKKDSAEAKE